MDFSFTPEQMAMQKSIREFAKKHIAPTVPELDKIGGFSQECWSKMSDLHLHGLLFPEAYGGSGAGALDAVLAFEAFAEGSEDLGLPMALGAHMILCGVPIWKFGTAKQKEKYLTKMSSGELIGAFALTEPEAGSNAANIRTRAVKKGDKYIINGTKMFITNGPVADVAVVIAVTAPEKGVNGGMSAFLVEKSFPGFIAGKDLEKLGCRASTTSELIFENCEVPEENLLGAEGKGLVEVAQIALEWDRGVMVASRLGRLKVMLEKASEYALQRVTFGKPLAKHQEIRHKIADIKVALEAARLLVYRAAWLMDQGIDCTLESSVAKLYLGEAIVRSSSDALQIFGGYGYIKEFPMERFYRDAKLAEIGGGTSEIQRQVISREVFKMFQ